MSSLSVHHSPQPKLDINLNHLDELSLDLRISLLYSCFQQSTYSRIIKSLPVTFCYESHGSPPTEPNFNLLKKTLKQFPAINNLKKIWIHSSHECRALMEWFASIPMKHMHPKDGLSFLSTSSLKEIRDSNCKHQFMIERVPKYKEFIESKAKYGSIIAYHGSPTFNWHAIIQHNLQNMSNTKAMTSGALFGSGIYLTSAISLSRSFSKMGKAWDKSKLGASLSVVGVFEVVLHPQFVKCDQVKDKKMKAPKHYYIVKDNRYIELRGLLVWKETKRQQEKKTKVAYWVIFFYLILLIALIMSQTKWDRVKKQTLRVIHNFLRMR